LLITSTSTDRSVEGRKDVDPATVVPHPIVTADCPGCGQKGLGFTFTGFTVRMSTSPLRMMMYMSYSLVLSS
jgi:hypothetical protein